MAGQGITVSILAKIEGWLDLIKLIQNAMKNIKPGTDISKGLVKDLQLVNDMVNNLGKNMNQRLTSDSLITGFVDKIMQVEEVFGRLGTSMSHISFGDINPEYITAGFKDLLSTLELANNALGQGMESSFRNAIANSKTLLKEFERMKIDPKTMNIDTIKEALAERGKSLEKDVNDGLKKLTDFEKGLEKLKNTRDELAARDKFLGKDANATAQSLLIGHQLPTKGTILDSDKLEEQLSFFRSNLLKAGFTPTQLSRIIPDLESVMKAGHWDEMPTKFANYLREAQNRTRNSLEKASLDYGAAVLLHLKMAGALSHLSALRFNNTLAQNEVGNILSGTVQNDTRSLRDVVNNLKQQLELAVISGFKGLGSKLFSSSLQGMQDASAAMKDYSAALDLVKAKELAVSKVQGVVLRYFSIYAAVRMVSKGIRSMMTNIKDLDKTITEIAIVTKMDQNDLWGLMPQYTKLAKNYAASISGVYKVSQLYYQQGLGQLDVMALTELTLKMARISGLDYAEATDYMTNAVRSFKMEMTDAATVVDVYSAVAASSASSVTELATAMSKTASSAAAVGSSFENTTAMLAVMIEATRESPENIGSAMKSIISRYGELKENKTGIDEEGEEYSLNKVDKALLTVGISIHDVNGEFRDFDDVIFELAEKWNTIDKNTLRYIATVMAGNRQQSRFLALVSSAERLKEESEKAANSEDASQLQFLKTMDSIEAKTQLFLTSLLSLYTSSGLENLYKGLLDFGNEFATTLENISSKLGLVGAIGNVGASFTNMATLATTGFGLIKTKLTSTKLLMETFAKNDVILNKIDQNEARIKELAPVPHTYLNNGKIEETPEYTELKQLLGENVKLQLERRDNNVYLSSLMRLQQKMAKILGAGMAASAAGMALSAWANSIDINENRGLKGGLTIGSSALLGLGTGLMVGASAGGPIGALVGVLTALPGILAGAGMLTETMAERILHLEKDITDTKNLKLKSKDELKTLEDYKKKYDELSKSLYESAEKKKEFMELSNSIAASYPELIKSMDAEGNYILNMAEGYERLAEAKRSAYQESLIDSIAAETAGLKDADYVLKNVYGLAPLQNKRAWHGLFDTSSIESLMGIDYKDFTEEEKTQVANLLTNRETANLVFSNLKDEKGNLIDFYSFGPNLAAQLSTVYLEFINKINENKDYSTAVSAILEQLGDSYTWLIEAFGTDVYKELKTRKNLPEYLEKLVDNATGAYNTELVNLLADQTEETFDITSNDILKRFAKELISKEFTEWKSSLDTETLTNPEKWKEAVKNFYNKYDAVWYKIEYESDLISGLSDDINDFYQDMGKHTKADIRKLFPEGELTDILQLLLKWLEDIFDLDFEDAFAKLENISKFKVKDYSDKVGADYLTQIQSQYKNIISNTGLSEKLITDQVAALNDITDFITDLNLDFDTRNTLLTKYSAADLTSLNGIYSFIDVLSNLDIDLDLTSLITKVHSLGDVLAVNFEAEIDSYYDAIESSVSDFNKAVKSVTEGTDLKTAREIADKMGKSLKDFLVKDGKFYFDDIEALKEAYIKENEEYIADVLKNVNERYSTLELLSEISFTDTEGKTLTIGLNGKDLITGNYELKGIEKMFSSGEAKTGFLQATGITFTEFTKYYEEYLKELESGIDETFLTFMQNKVKNTLDESGLAILDYLEQNTASSLIKSGDFKGFFQTVGLVLTDEEINKLAAQAVIEKRSLLINDFDSTVNDLILQKKNSAMLGATTYANAMLIAFNLELQLSQHLYDEVYLQEIAAWKDIYLILEELELIAKDRAAAEGGYWKDYYKKLVAGKTVTSLVNFNKLVKDSTERELGESFFNLAFDYNTILADKYNELLGADDKTIKAEAEKEALLMMGVSSDTWQKIMADHPDFTVERLTEILSSDAEAIEALEESEKLILEDIRESQVEELVTKIMSGDYSDLKDGNELFIGELYEYATSSAKTVMSSLTTALSGGENKIKITTGNKGLLELLKASSIITNKELIVGDLAEIDIAALKGKTDNEFIALVDSLLADSKTKLEWILSFLDVKYPNKVELITSLAGKEKTISRSDFLTYLDAFDKKNESFEKYAEEYGLAFNQYTNSWDIEDYDKYIASLKADAKLLKEGSQARRDAEIAIDAADRQRKNKETQDLIKAFEDVIKNYNNVTDDLMTALLTALKDDWYLVEQMLTPTGTGEYLLDVAKLRNNLDLLNISDSVKEAILKMFTSTVDDYLKNISSATDLLTKGTTSLSDIQDFKDQAKALGMNISDSAFHYDDILQAWTLDPATLRSFVLAQGLLLINMGVLSLEEVIQYVNDNVTKTLLGAIDVKGFLEAEDKSGLASKKLAKQLSNAGFDSHDINSIIDTLTKGGSATVNFMQTIATLMDEELTSADIELAYRAQVSQIELASEQLTYGVGSLVSGDAIQMLTQAGYKLELLGNSNNAVITQIGDIATAYLAYYDALKGSNEATLAALNEAKAKVYETKDGRAKEQTAIDALGDAAGMTYTTFGAVLSDMGIEMTDELMAELESSQIIESMGGNKMRIKDFASFARRMNWDYNSEEYLSAFSTFNDGLAELRTKNLELVKTELEKLKDAKPGDLLNLTYTVSEMLKWAKANGKDFSKELKASKKKLNDARKTGITSLIKEASDAITNYSNLDYITSFTQALAQTGAILKDSTLDLEHANKLGVANVLQEYASVLGPEMGAELRDLAESILTSYSDAITKGIDGGMTNVEAGDLIKAAQDMGITLSQPDFLLTAEGLLLSADAATRLYEAMSGVDALQGNVIYKKLLESLKANNKYYKTSTSLLSYASRLLREINEATEKTGEAQDKLNKKLNNATRAAANSWGNAEDSWDFTAINTLPQDTLNEIEYYTAWASVMSQMDTWATTNRVDPETFSDTLYHVEEIADATGKSIEIWGQKIGGPDGLRAREAMVGINDALKSSSLYGAYWDANILKTMGWDLSGATINKSKLNIFTGIDGYFSLLDLATLAWNDFVDGPIALSEQMARENISEDSLFGEDGILNFDAFLSLIKNENVSEKWATFAKNVLIGTETLDVAFSNKDKFGENAKEYSQAVSALFGMMSDTNWDNSDRLGSLASMMSKYNFNGRITVDGTTIVNRNGKVVVESTKNGKTTIVDDLGNEYEDINTALNDLALRELDDYAKEFKDYLGDGSGKSEKLEFTIAGQTYTIKVDGDHFILINENGDVVDGDYSTPKEALAASREDRINQLKEEENEARRAAETAEHNKETSTAARSAQKKAKELREALEKMSNAGYTEWVQSGLSKTGKWATEAKQGKGAHGYITADTRSKLISGKYTAESLKLEAIDLWQHSGLSKDLAAAEFKIKTGIDLDPNADLEKIDWNDYINLTELTQAAADVALGITAAFNNKSTTDSISGSIKTGINDALKEVSTGEDGSVDIKFKGITDNIPPEEAKDEEKTVKYKVDFTPPTVKPIESTVTYKAIVEEPNTGGSGNSTPLIKVSSGTQSATGTIGLANAKGTLMGELGPELVVSGGRYFVVGQSGPEMVDLADDAIVFNHLQTKSLLEKGTSSTRGRAITNELNAVAYATGSRNGGPAHEYTSFSDTRYNDSGKDKNRNSKNILTSTTPTSDTSTIKAYIKELERWYNWLQKIAHIEKEISYEEALRSKYQSDFTRSGKDYFNSLKKTLDLLQDLIVVLKDLVEELKKYLELRKQELAHSPFSQVYTFDERGQIEYQEGAFEKFSELFGTDDTGAPYYTAAEQYLQLVDMGMEEFMKYDSSGNEIDKSKDNWEVTAVQAFYDRMEKEREEFLSLHDDIMDGEEKLVELQDELNQILQEIEDNQIEVENKVLKAVEENHLREIDTLQDLRDAIEDSATKMIDGLSDALSKEQEMYNTLQEADELLKLQRQLAIMQRSGGSAAQIADLQEQIADKQLSLYFDIQQLQIDALQAASDAELERLDHQIDLMQETLDYQKEYGLLWNEVNTVLLGTPEDIAAFIKENTSDYWNKSATDIAKTIREDLFEIDRFKAYLELMEKGVDLFEGMYGEEVAKKKEEKAKAEEKKSGSSGGSGGSGGETGGKSTGKGTTEEHYYRVMGQVFETKKEAEDYLKKVQTDTHGAHGMTAEIEELDTKTTAQIKATKTAATGITNAVIDIVNSLSPENLITTLTNNLKSTSNTNNATEHRNSAGNKYYTATDPKTGKTISGNEWYMKQHGIKVASGGYVNHGFYELGELGTETVLTASQTKILRDNILSNRPDSLINLLKSYNEAYHGLSQSTYDSISDNSNEITIERAEVNLLIEKLADDYDSKRAANTIMDEMLRIASKTSANNSVRR